MVWGPFTLLQTLAVHLPHHLRLFRPDGERPAPQRIAVHRIVAEGHPPPHGLELAPQRAALGDLTALLLGHAGHDGQAELPVALPGVDAVAEKENAHVPAPQLPGDLQGIHGVAGKAGDLLGQNKVHLPGLGQRQQGSQLPAVAQRGTGQALVGQRCPTRDHWGWPQTKSRKKARWASREWSWSSLSVDTRQ